GRQEVSGSRSMDREFRARVAGWRRRQAEEPESAGGLGPEIQRRIQRSVVDVWHRAGGDGAGFPACEAAGDAGVCAARRRLDPRQSAGMGPWAAHLHQQPDPHGDADAGPGLYRADEWTAQLLVLSYARLP